MVSTTAAEVPAAETSQAELTIGGMTCASCAARVEKKLNRMDGVTATVNYATEKARVSFTDGTTLDDLVATVEKTGYTAQPVPGAADASRASGSSLRTGDTGGTRGTRGTDGTSGAHVTGDAHQAAPATAPAPGTRASAATGTASAPEPAAAPPRSPAEPTEPTARTNRTPPRRTRRTARQQAPSPYCVSACSCRRCCPCRSS